MRARVFFFFLLLTILHQSAFSGNKVYKYRVYFKDKANSIYSLEHPEQFLSQQAIERRRKQNIALNKQDLPISSSYWSALERYAKKVEYPSKWLNTVVITLEDEEDLKKIKALGFVRAVRRVYEESIIEREELLPRKFNPQLGFEVPDSLLEENPYGKAWEQLHIHNGERLHYMGYRGKGVCIALLENGFRNVNELYPFSTMKIRGARNFVSPNISIYKSDFEGTRILSIMAANEKGNFVGFAPEAEYVLAEVSSSSQSFPVDEDRWVCAMEYADSLGADLVVSSIGFTTFHSSFKSYVPEDLNGNTAFCSQAVSIGIQKGLLYVLSVGDGRGMQWRGIHFPSDCRGVLSVGAVGEDDARCAFSTSMITKNKWIKPDVVSLGMGVSVVDYTGLIQKSDGIAYSMAMIAGLTACMKQAFPQLSSWQLFDAIKRGGQQEPATGTGFGKIDFFKAFVNARRMAPETQGNVRVNQ